jgi:hypothetical protein
MARNDFINSLRKYTMAGMSPIEALNKVAKESSQSPLEILSIMGSSSEVSLYRGDLEQRIQNYIKLGISPVESWSKVARDIGISLEMVERIITQYPAGEASFWDRINKYRNKIRYLIATILILSGLMLSCDSETVRINRYVIAVDNTEKFSIGIVLLISGIILLIKSARKYLAKE